MFMYSIEKYIFEERYIMTQFKLRSFRLYRILTFKTCYRMICEYKTNLNFYKKYNIQMRVIQ